ncbi:PAS domain-containing sensor histidine kinase [Algoriphagus algorifonticola]|uniref:PAS domain-containing sensor histidine kinase n=1 Tax=Algoriphagus algorifonticola TaxID=2593007 RepID=UPI0011A71E0B|nr:PAS domain-containing protein [Algoriphagus algorifonticola]
MENSYFEDNQDLEFQKQLLEELTQSGTWELNTKQNKLSWSQGVFKMLGYQPNEFELTFEKGLSVIHPEDRKRAIDHLDDVLHSSKEYNIKKRLLKKDGTPIWVISRAKWIKNNSTGETILCGAFRNITEILSTKRELEAAVETNQSLFENLDGIFWEADAQTFEFTFISSQVEKITGFTREEWLNDPEFWQKHIVSDDREEAINFCHIQTQKQKDHSFDYRFVKKNGKIIWLNDRVKVVIENGKPVKLQGMMVDITREKNITKALQEEIALNQSFLHKLPGIFFLFDLKGKIILWNHNIELISGYSDLEIREMKTDDFFIKEDQKRILEEIKKVAEEDRNEVLMEIQTKDGRKIPVHFSASLIPYQGKSCILGIGQDIRELVESKRLIEENIERYELVTKATNEAIWDYDFREESLHCGDGFFKLFGYVPSEMSLKKFIQLIHPNDQERVSRKIQEYLTPDPTKANWLDEFRFKKKNDIYTYVVSKAIFLRNKEGYITRVVGSIQDISHQKEYERSLKSLNEKLELHIRELAFSNQELQRFAFIASHDLQEPLRMISSFMGLLEKRYGDKLDEKALKYISFATEGAKQMQRIILDLLEHSRVGSPDESKMNLSIEKLVKEIQLYLKKIIQTKAAKITYDQLPTIQTFKTPLFQILMNLISNSIKYAHPERTPIIHIDCKELKTHWQFSVSDNGIGISPEYYEKIFIIFERLHTKDKFEGTGIGLAIVKKAVEYLGGEIKVKSEINVGSTFTFTFKK